MSEMTERRPATRTRLLLAGAALVLLVLIVVAGLVVLVARRHASRRAPVTIARATAATNTTNEPPRDGLLTEAMPQPRRDPFSRDGGAPEPMPLPLPPTTPSEAGPEIAPVEPTLIAPPSVAPRGEDAFESVPAPDLDPEPEPISPPPRPVPSPALKRGRETPPPAPAPDPAALAALDQSPPDWSGPPPPAEGGYRLSAVVLGKRPQAVVKDGETYRRLRPGDTLGEYTVERIERTRLLLRAGSHRYSLHLPDEPAVGGARGASNPLPEPPAEPADPTAATVRPRRLGPLPTAPENLSGTTP